MPGDIVAVVFAVVLMVPPGFVAIAADLEEEREEADSVSPRCLPGC